MRLPPIPFHRKLLFAFALNTFFYGVLMYVNLRGEDRSWAVIIGESWPILCSEFFIGSWVILGWLYIAEWVHEGFENFFGEEILSKGGWKPNVAAFLVCSILVVTVNYAAVQFIYWLQIQILPAPDATIRAENEYARAAMRFGQVIYIYMAMLVYYLLSFRRVVQRLKEASVRAEKAQKQRVESEYLQLRNRVNPHFLFNSLSTLSSLVHLDAERSELFIEHLSKAYRYLLETRDRDCVSLASELLFLHSFAFLQMQRFDQKFRIEIEVSPEQARAYCLLPLTLQALTERAIRYNRMSVPSPLVVRIYVENHRLVVENNRQARRDVHPGAVDCDWATLEKQYLQWGSAPDQGPADEATEHHWRTLVPMRPIDTLSPQPATAS